MSTVLKEGDGPPTGRQRRVHVNVPEPIATQHCRIAIVPR
jgi:hypothetical protein